MEHGEPVEPMIIGSLADLELGGPVRSRVPVSQEGSVPVTGSATGSAISAVSERKPRP